jgi:hypothetical protein
MKKYILALAFSIISIGTFAQTIRYGLKAGINKNTLVYDNNYSPSQTTTGYNLGGFVDIGFGDFIIEPGLLFIKNGRTDLAPIPYGGMAVSNQYVRYYQNYVQLPVNLLVNFEIAKPVKMRLGAGPYVAFPAFSSAKYYGSGKSTDTGANIFAGIVVADKYVINAQYAFGLSGYSEHNRMQVLSVGYLFK